TENVLPQQSVIPPTVGAPPIPPNVYVSVALPSSPAAEGKHWSAQAVTDAFWPVFALTVILIFRKQLSDLIGGRGGSRIKSVSFPGISFELAATAPELLDATLAATDIRKAGSEKDVNDSTLRSFYEQISARRRLLYNVVDIGGGGAWLTSRLFILAVIM